MRILALIALLVACDTADGEPLSAINALVTAPALATSCGTVTVVPCVDGGARWFTALIPEYAKIYMQGMCFCTPGPFGTPTCSLTPRPDQSLDVHAGGNKKLYCGTDSSHASAYWRQ